MSTADFEDGIDNVGNELITSMGGVVLKNRLILKLLRILKKIAHKTDSAPFFL